MNKILDKHILNFTNTIEQKFGINKFNLFLYHKWGHIIKDNIIEENGNIFILDENNIKYIKLDKNWDIIIV